MKKTVTSAMYMSEMCMSHMCMRCCAVFSSVLSVI